MENLQAPKERVVNRESIEAISVSVDGYLDLMRDMGLKTRNSRETVRGQVMRFVDFFNIDGDFFSVEGGKIRPFILIGLADRWIDGKGEINDENRSTMELAKILCGDDHLVGWGGSSSGEIRRLAQSEYRFASEYDSQNGKKSLTNLVWKEMVDFAKDEGNINREETNKLRKEINEHNSDSILSLVRGRLGITKSTELRFNSVVVNLNSEEMIDRFKGTVAFFSEGVLCLPRDYDRNLIEHEYIHSQEGNTALGSNHILGLGINEAWTEFQTTQPNVYLDQIYVLKKMFSDDIGIKDVIRQNSRERTVETLDNLWGRVMLNYGIDGLISVLRLASEPNCMNEELSDYYRGKLIFMEPFDVNNSLKKIDVNVDESHRIFKEAKQLINGEIGLARLSYDRMSLESAKALLKIKIDVLRREQIAYEFLNINSIDEAKNLIAGSVDKWLKNPSDEMNRLHAILQETVNKFPEHMSQLIDMAYSLLNEDSEGILGFLNNDLLSLSDFRMRPRNPELWLQFSFGLAMRHLEDYKDSLTASLIGFQYVSSAFTMDSLWIDKKQCLKVVSLLSQNLTSYPHELINLITLGGNTSFMLLNSVLNRFDIEQKNYLVDCFSQFCDQLEKRKPRNGDEEEYLQVTTPRIRKKLRDLM